MTSQPAVSEHGKAEAAVGKAPAQQPETNPIPIVGRFDKYRSSFWAGLLAFIPARYVSRPFLRKFWDPVRDEMGKIKEPNYYAKHAYAATTGLLINGVTTYYAVKTWEDIRNIYAQGVAWELGKKPEEVTRADITNSSSTVVQEAVKNFTTRNLKRFGFGAVFFLPFLPGVSHLFKRWNMHAETAVDLGLAGYAGYLLSDVIGARRETTTEKIQVTIDRKVNHTDNFNNRISADELLDIYERHAAGSGIPSFLSQKGTAQWANSMSLFERMADLMNQTYKNTLVQERADFGFPQFIYMMGHGKIDPQNVERSKALVEIANQRGVPEMGKASQLLAQGAPLESVRQAYGLAQAEVVPQEVGQRRFTELHPSKANLLKPAASVMDWAKPRAAEAVLHP